MTHDFVLDILHTYLAHDELESIVSYYDYYYDDYYYYYYYCCYCCCCYSYYYCYYYPADNCMSIERLLGRCQGYRSVIDV